MLCLTLLAIAMGIVIIGLLGLLFWVRHTHQREKNDLLMSATWEMNNVTAELNLRTENAKKLYDDLTEEKQSLLARADKEKETLLITAEKKDKISQDHQS